MGLDIAKSKILVTGGAGFLGSHVVEEFERRGARGIVIPQYPAVDLRERDCVRQLLDSTRPDLIVHLAASVGGIGANRASPGSFFYDNMVMGLHILEEALKAEDLVTGMQLKGTVRNVVDFGAFVDIGVKQDGLLHRTQIPTGTVLKVGDIIDVEILKIEHERGRIGLGWVRSN